MGQKQSKVCEFQGSLELNDLYDDIFFQVFPFLDEISKVHAINVCRR